MITKATELNALVSAAYQDILKQTKLALGGCLRSRGRKVYVLGNDGNILPQYECEGVDWTGTQRQLDELLKLVGTVQCIGITVALDYAESVRDFADGCYDPIVAEAEVIVWSEDEATCPFPIDN